MNNQSSKYFETLHKNSSSEFDGVTLKCNYNKHSHGDSNIPSYLEGEMRTKKRFSKVNKDSKKSKLDTGYLESLVNKVQQLKSRMVYFENQFPHQPYDYLTKAEKLNSEVGDFQKYSTNYKCEGDVSDSACDEKRNSSLYNKTNTTKTHFDHHRSIYTSNEQNPLFTPNIVKKDSNGKFNKTNVSIVMSMQSGGKEDCPKCDRSCKVNPRQFQTAAEEFIQQAEELKSKIAYILECCGYTTPGSECTPSAVPSDCTSSINSKKSLHSANSHDNCSRTLETITDQYKQILSTLTSIDNNLKRFARSKIMRNMLSHSIANLEEKSSLMSTETTVVDKNSSSKSVALDEKKTRGNKKEKSYAHRQRVAKTSKEKKCNVDNLEPIVMVYEPIEPQNCKECGRKGDLCSPSCKQRQSSQPKSSRNKGNRDDSSQKLGFVVTYTPNIPKDSKSSIATRDSQNSGKTPCCFGF